MNTGPGNHILGGGGGIYRNHPVGPSVYISLKCNYSLTDKSLVMKRYTAVVYNLKMCMTKAYPGQKNINGDHYCETWVVSCKNVIWLVYKRLLMDA